MATGLPDFVVIGGARCGTTSLHYYLSLHPEICVFREKEPNFFCGEENWHKGIEWYRAGFACDREVKVRGEVSPRYTSFPTWRDVPKRMRETVPDARLVYLVRDPLERMISHYYNSIDNGFVSGSLEDNVRDLASSRFVQSSRQAYQLEKYLEHFPQSQILVLPHAAFANERRKTLARIFEHIGADPAFWDDRFERQYNASSTKRQKNAAGQWLMKLIGRRGRRINPAIGTPLRNFVLGPFSKKIEQPQLDPALRAKLLELFREDTERLRRLTGLALEGWCAE